MTSAAYRLAVDSCGNEMRALIIVGSECRKFHAGVNSMTGALLKSLLMKPVKPKGIGVDTLK
jgi:hypothetical protein